MALVSLVSLQSTSMTSFSKIQILGSFQGEQKFDVDTTNILNTQQYFRCSWFQEFDRKILVLVYI